MTDLCLAVKKEYFDQIDRGEKPFEFREMTEYWHKRIVGKDFDTVTIALGYPKKEDKSRRITFDWEGYCVADIRHKEFGDDVCKVFAINLQGKRHAEKGI